MVELFARIALPLPDQELDRFSWHSMDVASCCDLRGGVGHRNDAHLVAKKPCGRDVPFVLPLPHVGVVTDGRDTCVTRLDERKVVLGVELLEPILVVPVDPVRATEVVIRGVDAESLILGETLELPRQCGLTASWGTTEDDRLFHNLSIEQTRYIIPYKII